MALNELDYRAVGIRIDSGDLAYLSKISKDTFEEIAVKYNVPWFADLQIFASNDINEETIFSLNEQVLGNIVSNLLLYICQIPLAQSSSYSPVISFSFHFQLSYRNNIHNEFNVLLIFYV